MDSYKMGNFLSNLRKQKNLTQKDVAEICSVSMQAVSKWERGESVPDIQILEKLSLLYSISINEIIAGNIEKKTADSSSNKNIISLVMSVLAMTAFFFNYVIVNDFVFTGYSLLFHSTNGQINTMLWIIFLVALSYLIIDIFKITGVLVRSKLLIIYYLLSGLLVFAFILIGLYWEIFLVYPQLILIITFLIIYSQNISFEQFDFNFPFINHYRNHFSQYQYYKKNRSRADVFDAYQGKIESGKLATVTKIIYWVLFVFLNLIGIYALIELFRMIFMVESFDLYFTSIISMLVFIIIEDILFFPAMKYQKTKFFGLLVLRHGVIMLIPLLITGVVYLISLGQFLLFGVPAMLMILFGLLLDDQTSIEKESL